MNRISIHLSTRALAVPSYLAGISIFDTSCEQKPFTFNNEEKKKVSKVNVSVTFEQYDKQSRSEFFNILNREFIRETAKLVHPIVGSLNDSWPYVRSEYRGTESIAFEKPFVFGKYEIEGNASFLRGVDPNDRNFYRLRASASGTHGSVHSSFINGGIGSCLAASAAGLYSAILRPLDWRNPSITATNSQLLIRFLIRVASISSFFLVGGLMLDFSSQFIEQVRREIDVLNQLGSAASLAILMSLMTKPRTYEKSLRCVTIFCSLVFIMYHMDEEAAKHRGTTNALMSFEIPRYLRFLYR